ncbi:Uncharacterised protein [Klebsiella pneumoniae]|uniref:Uncharacterized protein n=1 Tax=Klebsiella pneumoniae TaxID=573 RepID=A0A377XHH4_KLEPN|nr:Uncharacterised protein [Klebsiella pneumoniae]
MVVCSVERESFIRFSSWSRTWGTCRPTDDLNPVAAAYYPVGAQRFKDVVTLRFRHIDQRDAQSGGAVVDAFNVVGAAEGLQEASGLTQPGLWRGGGRGFTSLPPGNRPCCRA